MGSDGVGSEGFTELMVLVFRILNIFHIWIEFSPVPVNHRRTARGDHGLHKVSLGSAMPNSCGRFRSARRAACGRLVPFWTPHAVLLRRKQESCSQNEPLQILWIEKPHEDLL
jgi:hypothetical protein